MNEDMAVLETLRDALAKRVEETSLRWTARECGLSPTGVKKVILGSNMYSPTKRKLRRWYISHACLSSGEVSKVDAESAIGVLTFDLPPQYRRATQDDLLNRLGVAYDSMGRARPRWIAELRAKLEW